MSVDTKSALQLNQPLDLETLSQISRGIKKVLYKTFGGPTSAGMKFQVIELDYTAFTCRFLLVKGEIGVNNNAFFVMDKKSIESRKLFVFVNNEGTEITFQLGAWGRADEVMGALNSYFIGQDFVDEIKYVERDSSEYVQTITKEGTNAY